MANGDYSPTAEENLEWAVKWLGAEIARGKISLDDAVLMLKSYLDEGRAKEKKQMAKDAREERLEKSAIAKLSKSERRALGLD